MIKKLDNKLNGQLNKVKILGKNLPITNENDYSFFKNIKLYLLDDEVYITIKDEAINKIFLIRRNLSERKKELVGINPDIRVAWKDGVYIVYANASRLTAFARIDDTVVCMKNISIIHRATYIDGVGHVLGFYTKKGWYYVDSEHRVYTKCDANADGAFGVKSIHSCKTVYIKEVFANLNKRIETVYERNLDE